MSSPGLTGRPSIPETSVMMESRGRGVLDRPVKPGDDSSDWCERRPRLSLQLPEQRIAAGNFDLAGRRLAIELLDHAVFHQH